MLLRPSPASAKAFDPRQISSRARPSVDTEHVAAGTDPTSSTSGRRRRVRRIACTLVGALLVLTIAGCESTPADRQQVRDLVNQARAQNGDRGLRENLELDVKADNWAQHLRNACALSHSTLSDGAPAGWQKLGENVGYGGSIDQVQVAYMNSPGHRANILDPGFTQVGTAAVWGMCNGFHRVFTVQEFMES
jgi:uncharacterized protein YkwD